MRIALVIRCYDHRGGGAERWTHDHAVRLIEAGHQVHLVSTRFTGAPDGAVKHHVEAGPRWFRSAPFRFAEAVERMAPSLPVDLIHDMGHTWSGDLFMPHHGTWRANLAMRSRLRRALWRLPHRLISPVLARHRTARLLEARQLTSPSLKKAVAVSRMIGAEMTRGCGLPEHKVAVIHNGVDLSFFLPAASEADRRLAKERLGVADRPVCLMIAHDFHRKGLERAVRAMQRLAQSDKPPLLLVIGKGNLAHFVRMARHLGCEHCVRLEGERHDILAYYHAADVFVLPTLYDPCSLVVLEALACGVPVVTTSANGAAELFTHGKEGLIVPDNSDPAPLAEAIASAVEPRLRTQLAAGALALRPRLSATQSFEKHVALYREIVGTPAARTTGAAVLARV